MEGKKLLGRILRSGGLLYFVILIVLAVVLVNMLSRGNPDVEELNSQQWKQAVQDKTFVTDLPKTNENYLTILDEDQTVTGQLDTGKGDAQKFEYSYTQLTDVASQLDKAGVAYSVDPQNTGFWLTLLGTLAPILLIVLFFILFMSSMQGGGNRVMSFGKSRARRMTKDQPKVTFSDVAGADEAVQELTEIKEFLEAPQKFQKLGARIPKGALLVGPPGTGKTLLARAVAGEAGVPFFSISGSDFVEMFVGVGASRVRDLFEQAKQNSPCIIFMDEIDAVGRHRGAGLGGGHDEREQTLNQLLVEMDGFEAKDNIIMIAATNRPDILDPALLRPGRFDRQITVDRPDRRGRAKILEVHTRGKPLAKVIDVDTLARRTPGFTGADLSNVLNEAALLTARSDKKLVDNHALDEAIDRVVAGPQKRTRIMSDKEKKITAYHEGGHALVAAASPNSDPVHKITILSRGRALGYTMVLPEEDKYSTTRNEMLDRLVYMMGGRAAEELVFHDPTTGAANDIEKATATARAMVTQYGMTERLGAIKFGSDQSEPFLDKETLGKEEIAEIFAPVVKRPSRPAWTGSSRRTPSTRPPVSSPALSNGAAPSLTK